MSKVSAIPENLIKYSAACTWGAQEFQNWVSAVLSPALLAYQKSGKGHPYVALDADVAAAISGAYYTDRDVDTVARAFQQTQHGSAPGAHTRVWADDSAVNSAFGQLQQQNQAKMQAGAALAKKLMALQPPNDKNRAGTSPEAAKPLIQELAKHANDPFFCAGFYNSLDAPHLDTALALGGIPALISAYSSGAVNQHTTSLVAMRIGAPAGRGGIDGPSIPWHHLSREQKPQLLDAFAANPSAAYHLAKSLTASQVRNMFYGDRQFSARVMKILVLGMCGENATEDARNLMHKVSIGLFGDGSPKLKNSEWKPLVEPVRYFYDLGVLRAVSPPTDFSKRGLEEWQRVTGAHIGQDVALFLKGLNEADPDNKLIKSMIQGGYVNPVFMPLSAVAPESIPFAAAVGALQSFYMSIDPGLKILDKAFKPGSHPDTYQVNTKLAAGAFTHSLSMLVAQGKVRDDKGELVRFHGDKRDKKLLTRMLDYPDDYKVGNEKVTVNELLDAYARSEQDEPLKALGNPGYKPTYE